MSGGASVKIEGIDEANRALTALEAKIRRRVIAKAVRAGGAVILKAARLNAPVRTKSLSRALRQSVKYDRSTGTVSGTVKLDRRKTYQTKWGKAFPSKYMHLVTLGTKPHEIRRRRKRAMDLGNDVLVGGVKHPGAKANDFMDRAARQSAHGAISAFTKRYGTEVEIAAGEVAK